MAMDLTYAPAVVRTVPLLSDRKRGREVCESRRTAWDCRE
jgi:hypothetical protein